MADFTLTARFPVPPKRVYDAWLDPVAHGAMTGSEATVDGDAFTAWGGYIEGEYTSREPARRIEMVWRTSDFGELENSATVTVEFVADDTGTLVTLTQTNTPASQGDRYVAGWKDFYFKPMAAYFV